MFRNLLKRSSTWRYDSKCVRKNVNYRKEWNDQVSSHQSSPFSQQHAPLGFWMHRKHRMNQECERAFDWITVLTAAGEFTMPCTGHRRRWVPCTATAAAAANETTPSWLHSLLRLRQARSGGLGFSDEIDHIQLILFAGGSKLLNIIHATITNI